MFYLLLEKECKRTKNGLTDSLKDEDAFWEKLIPYCEAGVKDVANVRDNALWLLSLIQVERHDLAFPITKAMGEHLRQRYESDYRNQRPDFGRSKGGKSVDRNDNDNENNDSKSEENEQTAGSDSDEKTQLQPVPVPKLNSHMRKVACCFLFLF